MRLTFLQETHPVFQPFDRGFGALAFGFPLIPAFQEEAEEFTGGAGIFVFRLIEGRLLLAVRVWNRVERFVPLVFLAGALLRGAQAVFFTTL